MYEVDFARGIAYKGNKGFMIRVNPKGLYIEEGPKIIFLTPFNSRIMQAGEIGYER